MFFRNKLVTSCLLLSVTACTSNPPAPVMDRLPPTKPNTPNKPIPSSTQSKALANKPVYKVGDWRPDTYMVKKGDTLFSIGLEHGYDYKDIAQANNINAPYNIKVGQLLKFNALKDKPLITENRSPQENNDGVVITPMNNESSTNSNAAQISIKTNQNPITISEPKAVREIFSEEALKKPPPVTKTLVEKNNISTTAAKQGSSAPPENTIKNMVDTKQDSKITPETQEDIDWAWPTKGKVVANFNEASNKGLDIAGISGQAVNAAAAGKVIYSGSDLRGYGKLVILKHNATYLSVYAHNSSIMVKEGQQVTRGQKIAEMGNTDSNTVNLHFEIRRQGQSVDPSKYLTSN